MGIALDADEVARSDTKILSTMILRGEKDNELKKGFIDGMNERIPDVVCRHGSGCAVSRYQRIKPGLLELMPRETDGTK